MSERKKSYIERICPECVFKPTYPQHFKFDLILKSHNYGELEIIVNNDDEIAEIRGNEQAIKKLNEEGQRYNGKFSAYFSPVIDHTIRYPFKTVLDISFLLFEISLTQTKEQNDQLENKDYLEMVAFASKLYKPIDEKILYEKTGIKIQY